MPTIQATWNGSRLLVWAVCDNAEPAAGASGETPPVALSREDLRRLCGELWDSLLVSTAADAQIELWLPFADDRFLGSAAQPAPGEPIRLVQCSVAAIAFLPADAVDFLDAAPRQWPPSANEGSSLRYWSRVAGVVLERLAQQRLVPTVRKSGANGFEGRWQVVLDGPSGTERVRELVAAMPPVCRAFSAGLVASAEELVDSFFLETADATVRRCLVGDELAQAVEDRCRREPTGLLRWLNSLAGSDPAIGGSQPDTELLWARVGEWVGKTAPKSDGHLWRTGLRLIPPEGDSPGPWRLALYAQSTRDASVVFAATDLPREQPAEPSVVASPFAGAIEQVRADAARAAAHFHPLDRCAEPDGPLELALTTTEAYGFLRDVPAILEAEGLSVWLPEWWRHDRRRLAMRMAIRPADDVANVRGGTLNLDALVDYDWRVALGDDDLAVEEIAHLAGQGQPLVRIRGRWAEVQPSELQRALRFLEEQGPKTTTLLGALGRCYQADEAETGIAISGFSAEGWVQTLWNATDAPVHMETLDPPKDFHGTLRHYQLAGLQWLSFLSRLGLGACLADDMGLGKTIQFIALLLHEREAGGSPGPTLLVVPMSLVGNWQREIERFGPSLRVMIHHGLERRTGQEFIDEAPRHDLVVSTYGLIHRDFEYLSAVQWGRLALDEAQNIKNPAAKQSVAVRSLRARNRIALTGTPVENHLSELWTIMDFLNPGYLATAADFRRRFAVPIERYRDEARTHRLRQLIRPCVLRRLKTDPHVQIDLPPKLEMKVYCNLTKEQAGLYQAIVNDMLSQIDRSEGIQRRGLVLAALVKLKQVCNHPLQLLADGSALGHRSGKCERLVEMLDEVLAEGDRALVFTQFREMGQLLTQLMRERLQRDVLFLHGGTARKDRDSMVEQFQRAADWPLFVLSLKAGGFGLNLTAANHVFHFDRWWNPAVEDQAADRAHRIGQSRQVQVHKFVCIGTLEERIDAMLDQKRTLAQSVIGAGESWITELSTDALRDLFALSREAVGDE